MREGRKECVGGRKREKEKKKCGRKGRIRERGKEGIVEDGRKEKFERKKK